MKKYREEEYNKYNLLLSKLRRQCSKLETKMWQTQQKLEVVNWEYFTKKI
jgi:phage shock protein A